MIGDLQRIDEREAVSRLGEDGLRLWRLAQGRDDRAVHAERETKSISIARRRLTATSRQGGADAHIACAMRSRRDAAAQGGAGRVRGDAEAAHWPTSRFARAAAAASEPRSLRRACSRRRARCWTLSPTASLIGSWGSRRRSSRRPKARTRTTCSLAREGAVRRFERRRSRPCAIGSAPRPCSAA